MSNRNLYFYLLPLALCLLPFREALALRIVSLLPSNTEILESLGAGEEVVGVTVFEPKKQNREWIGDLVHPNMEKIVSLKPDMIAAGLWKSSRAAPRLRAMGYRVVEIPNPRSVQDLYETIRRLAEAIGRPERADPVIAGMKRRFSRLQRVSRQWPRPFRAYIEISRGHWTPGGPDFITETFRMAGADNIFSDIPEEAAQVSSEVIVRRNPEVIITFAIPKEEIARRPGWRMIEAVKRGAILDDLDRDALSRPSPRLLDGLEQLSARLQNLPLSTAGTDVKGAAH